MNKIKSLNVLLALAGMLAMPGSAFAASLLEIYQQALQSDPAIHEAEARRLAALESKPAADFPVRGLQVDRANRTHGIPA